MTEDDEGLSPRQLARREVKEAGRRSAEAAHTLISMSDAALRHLDLEQGLREAFLRARTLRNSGARRREERRLAGVLRRGGLDEVEQLLANREQDGRADARLFQQVEVWRTHLLDEGNTALDAFLEQHPEADARTLGKVVHQARREQTHGKPKGAKKALFRQIATLLKG